MTLLERVAEYFQAHPNRWLDARDFLHLGGFAAWRTRISDLRKPPYNWVIENQTTRVTENGRSYTVSEYRWVPAVKGTEPTLPFDEVQP